MVRPQHYKLPAAMTMADSIAPSNDLIGPSQSGAAHNAKRIWPCKACARLKRPIKQFLTSSFWHFSDVSGQTRDVGSSRCTGNGRATVKLALLPTSDIRPLGPIPKAAYVLAEKHRGICKCSGASSSRCLAERLRGRSLLMRNSRCQWSVY